MGASARRSRRSSIPSRPPSSHSSQRTWMYARVQRVPTNEVERQIALHVLARTERLHAPSLASARVHGGERRVSVNSQHLRACELEKKRQFTRFEERQRYDSAHQLKLPLQHFRKRVLPEVKFLPELRRRNLERFWSDVDALCALRVRQKNQGYW